MFNNNQSKMKKAIVTVLLGNYDTLKPAPKYKDWETILITDKHYPNPLGWTIHKVKSVNQAYDSRYYKWLTHKFLPAFNLVCYIDASIELKQEPPSVETWFSHPRRKKVKTEAVQILKLEKSSPEIIESQLSFYKESNFKDNKGLYQNGFFVRNHDTETNKLCEEVYKIVSTFSNRDQLALPFVLDQTNTTLQNVLPGKETGKYIKINAHVSKSVVASETNTIMQLEIKQSINPVVHHITPGRSDLNYGKSINDIIKN